MTKTIWFTCALCLLGTVLFLIGFVALVWPERIRDYAILLNDKGMLSSWIFPAKTFVESGGYLRTLRFCGVLAICMSVMAFVDAFRM